MNEQSWEDRQDQIDFIESGAEYESRMRAYGRRMAAEREAQDDGLVTLCLSQDEIEMLVSAVRVTVEEYGLASVEKWYMLHGKLKGAQR